MAAAMPRQAPALSSELHELQMIVDYCRRNGITRYKTANVEVDLGPVAPPPLDPKLVKELTKAIGSEELTDEQALFMSAESPVSDDALRRQG